MLFYPTIDISCNTNIQSFVMTFCYVQIPRLLIYNLSICCFQISHPFGVRDDFRFAKITTSLASLGTSFVPSGLTSLPSLLFFVIFNSIEKRPAVYRENIEEIFTMFTQGTSSVKDSNHSVTSSPTLSLSLPLS